MGNRISSDSASVTPFIVLGSRGTALPIHLRQLENGVKLGPNTIHWKSRNPSDLARKTVAWLSPLRGPIYVYERGYALATGIICTYAPVFWTKGGVHHSGTAFLKPDVKPLTAKLPHYIAVASSTWEHGVVETVRLRGGRNEHLFAVLDFTKASRKHLSDRQRVAAGDYPEPGEYYKEGSARVFVGNAYERDTAAREACIRQQGYICAVCGFDFARTYGNLGANFIHVHHESPLSVGPRLTAPSRDLTPVCANCHAIVHRRRQIVSVKALKKVVQGLRRGRSSKGA